MSLDAFKASVDSQNERVEALLTTQQSELDLKKQIVAELEGRADLQAQVIEALQSELKDA